MNAEQVRLSLQDPTALDSALKGVDALVIATGARPSIDLLGPMRVDAWGVRFSGGKLFESWGVQSDSRKLSLCRSLASPPELVRIDSCLETNW